MAYAFTAVMEQERLSSEEELLVPALCPLVFYRHCMSYQTIKTNLERARLAFWREIMTVSSLEGHENLSFSYPVLIGDYAAKGTNLWTRVLTRDQLCG